MAQDLANKLPELLPGIVQRLAQGEYASKIAKELGTSHAALSYHLRRLPDYADIMESSHECRLDDAEQDADVAIQGRDFELARARIEQLKRREWRASVECSHRWGQRPTVAINIGANGALSDAELMRIAAPLMALSDATSVMSNAIHAPEASIEDVVSRPAEGSSEAQDSSGAEAEADPP